MTAHGREAEATRDALGVGMGKLTSLGHKGDGVRARPEGPVEMQPESEGLAPPHQQPLVAHFLRVMVLVVLGALQVYRPERQHSRWQRGGQSLPGWGTWAPRNSYQFPGTSPWPDLGLCHLHPNLKTVSEGRLATLSQN